MSEISINSDDDSVYLNSDEESDVELLREKIIKMHKEKKDLEKKLENLNNSAIFNEFNSKYKLKKLEFSKDETVDPFSLLNELISLISKIKNKLSELNDLIPRMFRIIKIDIVNPEYSKRILIDCFKISLELKDKKLVNDFFKLSS